MSMKPLQVDDFSGGITDKILQGAANRSAKLDNFLITSDRKLEERDAYKTPDYTIGYLPAGYGNRPNGLFSILNEKYLMLQHARTLYLHSGQDRTVWQNVTGVAGNPPLSSGDEYSQSSMIELRNQIFIASDSGGLTSKVYQDERGDWVARTGGLPKTYRTNPTTEADILNRCIALANDIKAKMILHMEDSLGAGVYFNQSTTMANGVFGYRGVGQTQLHANTDMNALSYLKTVSFVGYPIQPNVIPTPAPDATNKASLFVLIDALNKSLKAHVDDAKIGSSSDAKVYTGEIFGPVLTPYAHIGNRNYIDRLPKLVAGPFIEIADDAPCKLLSQACAQLDDLVQKYYFHIMGFNLHNFKNDVNLINKYNLSYPKIGKVYFEKDLDGGEKLSTKIPPTVTPNFSKFIAYVNNLKSIYMNHILDGQYLYNGVGPIPTYQMHKQIANSEYATLVDTSFIVGLADAVDTENLDAAFLIIYWLRVAYSYHAYDAANATWPMFYNSSLPYITPGPGTYQYAAMTTDLSLGTANLTDVKMGGLAAQLFVNAWVYVQASMAKTVGNSYTNSPVGISCIAKVNAAASGTATLDRNILAALSGTNDVVMSVTGSKYHSYITNGPATTSSRIAALASDLPSDPATTATTATGWLDLATELFNSLMAHTHDGNIHIGSSPATNWTLTQTAYIADINTFYLGNSSIKAPFFIPEIQNFSWAFYYSDRYDTNDGTEYLTNGAPIYTESIEAERFYQAGEIIESENTEYYTNAVMIADSFVNISNIPSIINTNGTNYDSDVKMNIYRTAGNGIIYYKLDQLDSGISTYVDANADLIDSNGQTSLVTREQLYTTGGIVGRDQIESAKYIAQVNGITYYAGVKDGNVYLPNRLRQSLPLVPDACPASFYDDFDDEIIGLGSARNNLIVLCKSSVFRENGAFTENGSGYMSHEKISDVVGGISQKSVVQTEIGVFYAGTDGYYYTDGYQVIKLSLEIDDTFASLTDSPEKMKFIAGAYDTKNRRVWWSMQNSDQVEFFVLHLNMGVKPSASFTKQFNRDVIKPASHVFWRGDHWFGHEEGYLMKSDANQKGDQIPDYLAAKPWVNSPVPFEYLSTAMDGGTIFERKYLTKMHIVGDNSGNMAIQPYIVRDMNSDYMGLKPLAPINYRDNVIWGQPSCVWGDPNTHWNNRGKVDEWRRFPHSSLRSDFFQIGLRPANLAVYASEHSYFPEFTTAFPNSVTKEVTISTQSSGFADLAWPTDIVGYNISFDIDDYTQEYEIISVAGNKLTVDDPTGGLSETPNNKFVIRGFNKNQRITVTSYVIHFANLGDKVKAYKGPVGTGGFNAGE